MYICNTHTPLTSHTFYNTHINVFSTTHLSDAHTHTFPFSFFLYLFFFFFSSSCSSSCTPTSSSFSFLLLFLFFVYTDQTHTHTQLQEQRKGERRRSLPLVKVFVPFLYSLLIFLQNKERESFPFCWTCCTWRKKTKKDLREEEGLFAGMKEM